MAGIIDKFRLDGKVAWITGASYGLGLAYATAYAEVGAKIVFNDINQELVDRGIAEYEKLGINYPIYHGVDESVLQIAIGHIQGSSLPVGGATTHAAISGHRGLPSAKLFSDLDKAVEGDTFTITVLNQTLTYQIDQIRIVEPGDMSELDLMKDQDLVTMITCTPYGINTHRMLVRAHRVENAASIVAIPAEAVLIPNYVAVPLAGVPMLFVYLVGALVYSHLADHEVNHETTKSELHKLKEARKARRKADK